jgi:S-(hydroxymethyl)glutathione dehydrogenase/alcohol dehydrogenase
MTGVGGTTTIVGILPMGATLEFPYALLSGEKRLATCTMGSNRFRTDIPRYLEFYRQGRLALDDLISRTLRLDDINEAFRAMKAGEVARQVIVFD